MYRVRWVAPLQQRQRHPAIAPVFTVQEHASVPTYAGAMPMYGPYGIIGLIVAVILLLLLLRLLGVV